MNRKLLILIFVLICVVFSTSSAIELTKTYVSLNGQFYIHYPEDWGQVPYVDIDQYLASKRAGRPLYNYEVVLAPAGKPEFYLGSYLFLTIDTITNMTDQQVDSVLNDLKDTFGKDVKHFPVSDFLADIESDVPSYDEEKHMVSVSNDIIQNNNPIKKLLLIKKFYPNGVANFYFYSNIDTFDEQKGMFTDIVNSFSTENVNEQLPQETLKVADIDNSSKDNGSDNGKTAMTLAPYIGFIAILIILIARKKRRKK